MKENKENLKTKKNGGFSEHVYKKATDFNFFTDLKKKGYETRNNEDSVFRSQNEIIKKW